MKLEIRIDDKHQLELQTTTIELHSFLGDHPEITRMIASEIRVIFQGWLDQFSPNNHVVRKDS